MRLLFSLAGLALVACGPVGPPPIPDACTPRSCEEQLLACGTADDGCGTALECGPACAPGDCDGGGCDGGGADDGGSDGGCVSESYAAFCQRLGLSCGPGNGIDNCGNLRSADCGGCVFPQRCGDAGTCGCTPKTCADVGRACGEAYVGCGNYLDCGPCADGGAPPPHPLRVTAANLSSGNLQSYDPGEGLRIFQGLEPDVVLIQEFNYGARTDLDIRRFVDQAFGPEFYVYREPGAQIPNGVISRYPIAAAGSWTDSLVANRSFVWARIDLPGAKDLWAVSLHLLTTSAANRASEASQLVGDLQSAVPAGDYLVLGGDLNTSTRTESCISTLAQVAVTAAPHPADQAANGNTNATRGSPFDWVLANAGLKALQVPLVIGANSFSAGLVFDSRVYTPLADVAPVQSQDSAALNMQHMAVSKQFRLP